MGVLQYYSIHHGAFTWEICKMQRSMILMILRGEPLISLMTGV